MTLRITVDQETNDLQKTALFVVVPLDKLEEDMTSTIY